MRFWYDITNTPQVHFLLSIDKMIKDIFPESSSCYSAREFSETSKLLKQQIGNNFIVLGGYYGKRYFNKAVGLLKRFKAIKHAPIQYDVSISCGSENAIWRAFSEHKKSIAFGDNDLARQWTYAHCVSYAFFPTAIPRTILEKQGLHNKLYQYHGFKEDIYLADYSPNESFLSSLPFSNYVLVRPENIQANYIRNNNAQTITPTLLKELSRRGYNILYLPRYETDKGYALGVNNLYIPSEPINGLDACYYADAVLTGAGTLAREAACLGVPSFSFFAGNDLLSVDKRMIADDMMFYSRNIDDLISHVEHAVKKTPDLNRSKQVQNEVSDKLRELINGWR